MRKLDLILPAILLTGSLLAPAALAQGSSSSSSSPSSSAPGVQRAPGMSQTPGEAERRRTQREGVARPGERNPESRAQATPPNPDRDLPMPRGVPSIIAP